MYKQYSFINKPLINKTILLIHRLDRYLIKNKGLTDFVPHFVNVLNRAPYYYPIIQNIIL